MINSTQGSSIMPRVKNKIAIVTGGASGLGAAIARRLAEEGAKVIITDLQEEEGQRLAKAIGGNFIQQNVADEEQWEIVTRQVEDQYGGLDILVNNAGIIGSLDKLNPEGTTLSDWQTVQRINVEGVFLGCRAAIPIMRQSGGGSIINMSSIAASGPAPEYTAYGASKASVRHLTKSVAMHCAKEGSKIRCNSVHPGIILTPMNIHILEGRAKDRNITFDQALAEYKSVIPQGEFTEAEDVAHAVLFLASDEARHITGIKLFVDGGMAMGE